MNALLVIPCYYESKRLPRFLLKLCELVELSNLSIAIQLVDDGSSQDEQKALSNLSQKLNPQYSFLREPLLLEKNLGKGGAVRAGWRKGGDANITRPFPVKLGHFITFFSRSSTTGEKGVGLCKI